MERFGEESEKYPEQCWKTPQEDSELITAKALHGYLFTFSLPMYKTRLEAAPATRSSAALPAASVAVAGRGRRGKLDPRIKEASLSLQLYFLSY